MTKSHDKKLEEHITEANHRFTAIENLLETIMTNHLRHVDMDLKELKADVKRQSKLIWWTLGVIAATTGLTIVI